MLSFRVRAAATGIAAALLSLVLAAPASATITIVLQNSFINKYANRATIDVPKFSVDATAPKPHPAASDGDMHAAGQSASDIGFATVVEIMNASDAGGKPANKALQTLGVHRIAGYWRLWPEHGGSQTVFKQFETLDPIDTTNPNHAFEIHPMLKIDSFDLSTSLHEIAGYKTKDATTAFQAYENAQCTITGDGTQTTIVTRMLGYNYVKLAMKLLESPKKHRLDDGFSFFVDVFDTDTSELVAHRVRMVVAGGTGVANAVAAHKKGDALVVLGIPRIDLSLVGWRAKNPDSSQWTLPYEMILAGIYAEDAQID